MSSWKGVEWATWHASLGSTLFQQPKWYVDFVALFAWNVSYKALYDLGYMLHNPFGDRRIESLVRTPFAVTVSAHRGVLMQRCG